jgi:hypothetical protein
MKIQIVLMCAMVVPNFALAQASRQQILDSTIILTVQSPLASMLFGAKQKLSIAGAIARILTAVNRQTRLDGLTSRQIHLSPKNHLEFHLYYPQHSAIQQAILFRYPSPPNSQDGITQVILALLNFSLTHVAVLHCN